jgi:hypothetical protein
MMTARLTTLACLVLALGCDPSDKDDNIGSFDTAEADADTDTDTDTDVDLELELVLDQSSTEAGSPVGYTVQLVSSSGDSEALSAYTLSSNIEDALDDDGSAITPTVAGDHTIKVKAEVDGETLKSTVSLEVQPGPLADLDLSLAATEVIAGEDLSFEVTGSDTYGNPVGPEDVVLSADSEEIVLSDSSASSTVAGTYTLTAQDGDVSDAEAFTVIAADPVSVTIELSETDIEEGESTDAIVTVVDEYGNTSEADWTIALSGTGSGTVDEEEISIITEGEFTATVTVDGTDLSGSIDFTVDSHGPVLSFISPDRSTWTTDESILVEGTVGDAVTGVYSLDINGSAVSWASDGYFSHSLDLAHGIQIIETTAADNDMPERNISDDARAVLQASAFNAVTEAIEGGIIVRLNEGEGGLDAVAEAAEGLMTPGDIEAMMSGTLVDDSYCYTVIWTVCVDYAITADDVSIGSVDVEIDTSGGQIRAVFTLTSVDLDGEVYSELTGWDDYTLSVDSIEITATLDASVDGSGAVDIDVDSVSTDASGLTFDAGGAAGAIEAIAEFAGLDVDGLIEDNLLGAIEAVVEDDIPPLIEDTLGSVDVTETFDIGTNSYTLSAQLHEVEVLYTGIELWMQTTMTPDEVRSDFALSGPDVPYAGYGAPTFAASDGGAEMAISMDFANQAMHAFWAGGFLDMELTDEDLGIEMAAIALVLPGLTDLTMVSQATLPPLLVPYEDGEEGENIQLQLGDLFVQIYSGEPSEETLYMELYISTKAPGSLSTTPTGDEISMSIGDPEVVVDVVFPAGSSPAASGAEGAFELLLPLFLPEITGAFGDVPIPSMAGFSLSGVSTSMIGTGGAQGYLGLSGDLSMD